VIVVLDGDASLGEYSFGNAVRTPVDYAAYAREKAVVARRERLDTSVVRERGAARGAADLPPAGGIHRRDITVGVSGAQPWFDEAFGITVVELLHALERQRLAGAT
jgi:hypothetical protein